MPFELLCTVANFVPRRFFSDKLMKLVFEAELSVEGIYRNGKTVLFREDLAKRCTANFAKASAVFVRGRGLVERDVFFALNPLQVCFFDKGYGAGANLAAPGAVTRPHH